METHSLKNTTKLQQLKLAMFSTFYEQNKSRQTCNTVATILIIISFLQLIAMYFESSSIYAFNDVLFPYFRGFADFLLIAPYLSESYNIYIPFAYAYLALILIYIASFMYIVYHSYRFAKPFFNFPLQILKIASMAIQWALFIPGIWVFLCTFKFASWTTEHIGHSIALSFGLIIHVVISFFTFAFSNIAQSTSNDALSRVDNSNEIFLYGYQILISVVSLLTNPTSYKYIGLVLHLLGGLYMVWQYYSLIPYYNKRISNLYGACCSSYLWVSVNFALTEILKDNNYGGQCIVIILGIIIIFPLTSNLRSKMLLQNVLDKKYDKIKNVNEIDLYLRELRTLLSVKTIDSFSDMVLMGYITNHKSECSNPECPINKNEKLYLPLTNTFSDGNTQSSAIYITYVINSIYNEFACTTYASSLFHYIYADFLACVVGNMHMALMELLLAEKCESGKQLEFSIYSLKRKMEIELKEDMSKKNQSKQSLLLMDPTVVIEFENIFHKFNKKLEKTTVEYIEFWNQLEAVIPDLNLMHKLGATILQSSCDLHSMWNSLKQVNPNYYKALWLYGMYLAEIKHERKDGELMIEKARQIRLSKLVEKNLNDFDTLFSDDTSLIIMSGEKESQGSIRQVSLGTAKLFGYKEFELIGHDISQLMPSIIAKHHNKYLTNYFKSGLRKIIGVDTHTFAISKDGFLMSVSLIVKPVTSLNYGVQYIGVLRQIFKDFDYIIVNEDGLINCVSSGITKMISAITPLSVQQFDVFLQMLCPDLLDMYDKTLTKFEVYSGIKRITFMIPKDLQMIIQSAGKDRDKESSMDGSRSDMVESTNGKKKQTLAAKITNRLQFIQSENEGIITSKNFLKQKINYAIGKKITIDVEICDINYTDVKFRMYRLISKDRQHSICSEPADNPQSIWVSDTTKGLKSMGAVSQALNKMSLVLKRQSNAQVTESDSKFTEGREETKDIPPPIVPISLRQDNNNNESIISLMNVITFQKTDTTSESNDQSKNSNIANPKQRGRNQVKSDIRKEPTTTTLHLNAADDIKRNNANVNGDRPFVPEFTTITTISQNFHEESMADIGLIEQKKDIHTLNTKNTQNHKFLSVNTKDMQGKRMNTPDDKSIVESSINISAAPNRGSTNNGSTSEDNDEGFFNDLRKNTDKDIDTKSSNRIERDVDQNTEGSVGSVGSTDNSSTKSVMKHLKSLTKSMYTTESSPSIKRLYGLAYIIFSLIMLSSFLNFFIGSSLFSNLEDNVDLIKFAQQRQTSVIYITSTVRELMLINQSAFSYLQRGNLFNTVGEAGNAANITNYQQWLNQSLWVYSCKLRDSQSIIGMIHDSENITLNNLINSNDVSINYGATTSLSKDHVVDSWTALMAMVLHAQNIRLKGLDAQESVNYIAENGLNSILMSITQTMSALSVANRNTAEKGENILLILMILSTVVCTVALGILIPVIFMISINVEEVLILFLQLKKRCVHVELEKCQKYLQAFKGEGYKIEEDEEYIRNTALSPMQPVHAAIDDNKSTFAPTANTTDGKKEEQGKAPAESLDIMGPKKELIDIEEEDYYGMKSKNPRKHKKFVKSIIKTITKFIISVAILEAYFVFIYMESNTFYEKVVCIIDEMVIINSRIFSNTYLYIAEYETIATKKTSKIQSVNCLIFVDHYVDEVIKEQEAILRAHSDNLNRNTRPYDEYFDNMMYKSACDQMSLVSNISLSDCSSFMGGILQKGLHSANVAYWDNIREILNEFKKGISISIDNDALIKLKLLDMEYLEPAYIGLSAQIELSIIEVFKDEKALLLGVFISYVCIVLMIFLIVWRGFILSSRMSLHSTKTMITIIPPEVIFSTRKIRDFLLRSTRQIMYQVK